MPADQRSGDDAAFRAAVAELEAAVADQRELRPEVSFDGEPPPRRLAPHAAAVGATVVVAETEIGWGRFVLLYDPVGQEGWEGPFRVIAYLRAALDPEIAADPLIGQVGWSWLTEALDARAAGYAAPSGTVTRVVSEGFGAKQGEPVATGFEMRASWSPIPRADEDAAGAPDSAGSPGIERYCLDRHVAAWADALSTAAGLPPLAPGVAQLRPARPARPSHQAHPRRRP